MFQNTYVFFYNRFAPRLTLLIGAVLIPPIHVALELPKAFRSFDPSCTICTERERVELCSCELLLPSGMGLCNVAFMGLRGVSVGVRSSDVDTFVTINSGGGTYELIKVNNPRNASAS